MGSRLALQSTDLNSSPIDQLVTTCLVGGLLKGEILGSMNPKRTNNLPGGAYGSQVRG